MNKKIHNTNWPKIHDHLCIILIIGKSGSEIANALLNLINHQHIIDKSLLFAKDPYEPKYKLLINNLKTGLNIPKIENFLPNIQMTRMMYLMIVFNGMLRDMVNNNFKKCTSG